MGPGTAQERLGERCVEGGALQPNLPASDTPLALLRAAPSGHHRGGSSPSRRRGRALRPACTDQQELARAERPRDRGADPRPLRRTVAVGLHGHPLAACHQAGGTVPAGVPVLQLTPLCLARAALLDRMEQQRPLGGGWARLSRGVHHIRARWPADAHHRGPGHPAIPGVRLRPSRKLHRHPQRHPVDREPRCAGVPGRVRHQGLVPVSNGCGDIPQHERAEADQRHVHWDNRGRGHLPWRDRLHLDRGRHAASFARGAL
mmetsp:Transcript_135617/g.377707  ORF Transcript_135617/g.377707 Transcript_135617/m.377707 type:complete len:260 (+) Transcript_135617:1471-2250(+)